MQFVYYKDKLQKFIIISKRFIIIDGKELEKKHYRFFMQIDLQKFVQRFKNKENFK